MASNIIQGITGFAGTLIAMPFLIMLVDLETSKQVLNVLGILGSLMIVFKDYKYIKLKQLFTIIVWMLIGLIVGLITYNVAPRNILLLIFPLFVLGVGINGLLKKDNNKSNNNKAGKTSFIDIIILLCAGIIHGLFVAGGPLLVVYATKELHDKLNFRATLSAVWIFLNSFMFVQALVSQTITYSIAKYMVISVVPMILGIMIGNFLLKKMNQSFFMKLSYCLLCVSGLSLLL